MYSLKNWEPEVAPEAVAFRLTYWSFNAEVSRFIAYPPLCTGLVTIDGDDPEGKSFHSVFRKSFVSNPLVKSRAACASCGPKIPAANARQNKAKTIPLKYARSCMSNRTAVGAK